MCFSPIWFFDKVTVYWDCPYWVCRSNVRSVGSDSIAQSELDLTISVTLLC